MWDPKKAIEKLDEIEKEYLPAKVSWIDDLREIILAGQTEDGCGWMTAKELKEDLEQRIADLEKSSVMHGNYIYNVTKATPNIPSQLEQRIAELDDKVTKIADYFANHDFGERIARLEEITKPQIYSYAHTGECVEGCSCDVAKMKKPVTEEKLFQCPECKVKSSFPVAHETSCSRRGMRNDKTSECQSCKPKSGKHIEVNSSWRCVACGKVVVNDKPSECKHEWSSRFDRSQECYCIKCGKRCDIEAISIPRDVAEEWLKHVTILNDDDEKMLVAVKQALKGDK